MGIKERRAKEKELLETKILEAARSVLDEHGYEGLTMRKIADKIEYSATTIYLYYKDKSELLYALSEETYGKIYDFRKFGNYKKDPLNWLRKAMRAYIAFGLRNPSHYKAAYISHPEHHQEMTKYSEWHPNGQRGWRAFTDVISACVEQGKFRRVDVEITYEVVASAMHGLVSLLIVHPDFPWSDKDLLIDHLIETTILGLSAPEQHQSA